MSALTALGKLAGSSMRSKTNSQKIFIAGIYVAAALATATIIKLVEKRRQRQKELWHQRLVTSGMV